MKTGILTAVSAVAIMIAAPAYAQSNAADHTTQNDGVITKQEMKQGWDDTKKAVSDAANDVAKATEKTYEKAKAAFISNDQNARITEVTVDERNTAKNIVGATVYNEKGESIAKVHDIILDQDGAAKMVVVADGEIFGLGKKVAFDYDVLMSANAEGEVIAPLSEKAIDQAAEFSYDTAASGADIRVIPANGYSVAALMKAKLVDPKGTDIASVENISFANGKAENLIVGFNKVLGIGGERAALAFADTKMVRDAKGDAYNFQLSTAQAAQFESFKKQF